MKFTGAKIILHPNDAVKVIRPKTSNSTTTTTTKDNKPSNDQPENPPTNPPQKLPNHDELAWFCHAKQQDQPTSIDEHEKGQQQQQQQQQQPMIAREDIQLLGRLRMKSGRSNLRQEARSLSLSCPERQRKYIATTLVCISPENRCVMAYLSLETKRDIFLTRRIR